MAEETPTLAFQGADASKINIITRGGSEPNPASTDTPPATPPADAPPAAPAAITPPATPPPSGEPAQTPPADTDTPPATPAAIDPPEYTEEQFQEDVNTYISETTGGAVRRLDDITTIIEENKTLKAQLQHKEPDFPSPVAKQIYELSTKAVGAELSTAKQLFHVLSLDLATMSAKDKQFEAFHLDRPHLTREDALKRFDATYEKSFSDLENDLAQLDSHDLATRMAETKIKDKMQALTDSVKQSGQPVPAGPTPEQVRETEMQLQSALDEFAGVSLKFDDSQYGELQIPMDRSKASEFMEVLKNPYLLIDRIADTCRDQSGKLNLTDFTREMYLRWDSARISEMERDHLMKLGKITQIQEQKNTPKKDLQEVTTTPVKKSFQETMAGAVKAAGMAN